MSMYRFCNAGHCFDFNPKHKIHPYPNKPPVSNLDFYRERVRQEKNKTVFIVDDAGNIDGEGVTLWVKKQKPSHKG
jgi:hypothetical protein